MSNKLQEQTKLEVFKIIDTVLEKDLFIEEPKTTTRISYYLEKLWPDEDQLETETIRLNLTTTTQIAQALQDYVLHYKPNTKSGCDVSRGAIKLVSGILENATEEDKENILEYVCTQIEEQFAGNKLESSLKQMRMESIKVVNDTINMCMLQKKFGVKFA